MKISELYEILSEAMRSGHEDGEILFGYWMLDDSFTKSRNIKHCEILKAETDGSIACCLSENRPSSLKGD